MQEIQIGRGLPDGFFPGIARSIAEELRGGMPQRTAEFVIADVPAANGDEDLLQAVMENLFQNAWKFTASNSVTRIEFGAEELDGRVTYFVRDNGVGFDEAFVGKLFTPFGRLHGRNEFEGTGIGLATVQRIIHRHGGDVRAESQRGKGATFYFTVEAG